MKKLTIRKKFMLYFIPIIVSSYLLLSIIANHLLTTTIIERAWADISTSSGIISTQIQRHFSSTSNCAKTIIRDLNYNENRSNLLLANANALENYELQRTIQNVLYDNSIFFPEVESLAFIDVNHNLYELQKGQFAHWTQQTIADHVEMLEKSSSVDVWLPMEHIDGQIRIVLGKKVMNMNNGYSLGYLFVGFSGKGLRPYIMSQENTNDGASINMIVDKNGSVVICSSETFDVKIADIIAGQTDHLVSEQSLQQTVTVNFTNWLLTITPIPNTKLFLINITDLDMLTKPAARLTYMIFSICAIVLIIGILLSGYLSKRITEPLNTLAQEVGAVHQGNFAISAKVEGNDEVAQLSEGISVMLTRIDELFQRLSDEQQRKRTLELSLLQSQIKPHFMYNTLDLIYVLCSMGRNEQAQKATKSLADYYRLVLSDGREIITISTELEHVRNYLQLQHMRYSDTMEYNISVDKDAQQCFIPKMTLQPLVENALYHGIRLKPNGGTITITGRLKSNHTVELSVCDNGVGMTEERMLQVLSDDTDHSARHFGLINVDERIRLFFPFGSRLSVDSRLGHGTCIHILINYQESVQSETND